MVWASEVVNATLCLGRVRILRNDERRDADVAIVTLTAGR